MCILYISVNIITIKKRRKNFFCRLIFILNNISAWNVTKTKCYGERVTEWVKGEVFFPFKGVKFPFWVRESLSSELREALLREGERAAVWLAQWGRRTSEFAGVSLYSCTWSSNLVLYSFTLCDVSGVSESLFSAWEDSKGDF